MNKFELEQDFMDFLSERDLINKSFNYRSISLKISVGEIPSLEVKYVVPNSYGKTLKELLGDIDEETN